MTNGLTRTTSDVVFFLVYSFTTTNMWNPFSTIIVLHFVQAKMTHLLIITLNAVQRKSGIRPILEKIIHKKSLRLSIVSQQKWLTEEFLSFIPAE